MSLPLGPYNKQSMANGHFEVRDADGVRVAWVPLHLESVAELLIRAEREADETPIDEAWLLTMGFVEYSRFRNEWSFKRGGIAAIAFATSGPTCWEWQIEMGGRHIKPATRGKIRKLFDALNIESKEPT